MYIFTLLNLNNKIMKHTIKINVSDKSLMGTNVSVHEFFNSLRDSYDSIEIAICKLKFTSLISSLTANQFLLNQNDNIKINNLNFQVLYIIIDVAGDYTQTEKIYYFQLINK